ncbi:uncharacterized protein PpBr36_09908 [Pyricularia pennisetigena]|uniref:uncharacterized protein n=1 Tax=Pyricularia pennisetigena TaxID=1578925 RepID=UPI00115322B4|nr:uncharacterized protein PpBr36_09908 [Pyricularia pennisetigena]TLS22284.1 hypothetical protein PpBr36_09908 [Pyricularia pennisetigena]
MVEECERQQTKQVQESLSAPVNRDPGGTEMASNITQDPAAVSTDVPNQRVESERHTNCQDEEVPLPTTTWVPGGNQQKPRKKNNKGKQVIKSSCGPSQPVPKSGREGRKSSAGNSASSTGAVYPISSDSLGPGTLTPDSESPSASRADLSATSHQRAVPLPSPSQPAPVDFTMGRYGPDRRNFGSQAMTSPESVRSGLSSSVESRLHHGDYVGSDHSCSDTCTAGSDCSSSHMGSQHSTSQAPGQLTQPWQLFHPIPPWLQPSRFMSRSVPLDVSMQIRLPSPAVSEAHSSRGALSETNIEDLEPVRGGYGA